jgi:hypothetical protein
MVKLTGGGIQGSKVRQSTKWKQEPKPKAVNPASVSTLGLAVQFPKPKLETGPGLTTKPQGSTGIAGARQGHAGVGPGGGSRVIYKAGSQSPTPAPKPVEKGHDILRDFGKDYRR